MDEIILMHPDESFAEDIWAFRREIEESNDEDRFAGCGGLEKCASVEEWCERCKLWSSEETCPEGKVPSEVFMAVRRSDRRIVGIIDLRHHIDHPILGVWGGHIGYTVRPSERRKGYAKEMLRQDIEKAHELGIERVMVTCDADNPASERTIIACGGVYEKSVEVDGTSIKRFWIMTS